VNPALDEAVAAFSFPGCPEPPGWEIDWGGLAARFPWLGALAACPQDPVHHAEGDVLAHTKRVCAALVGQPRWRDLPAGERAATFAASLMHDATKPRHTREEQGRITSAGHAGSGAAFARRLLWGAGGEAVAPAPLAVRELVAGLVRRHHLPLFFWDGEEKERVVIAASLVVRNDLLALLARADALGRQCRDQADLLASVDLYVEHCRDLGCLEGPRPFASAQTRFRYFRGARVSPDTDLHDDTRVEVSLLSGMPGAGKDTWLARNGGANEILSLDRIREEIGVSPEEPQGVVVNTAKERARVLLRRAQPFAWNATNVTRSLRAVLVDLFAQYKARVRIVYVDAAWPELLARNREREKPVPLAVLEGLSWKLEAPDPTEAHEVVWHTGR